MPNLGQGGQWQLKIHTFLGEELSAIKHSKDVNLILKAYERRRFIRASIAQFLSRNGSDLLSVIGRS
jgi:hypothetical protein